jgi:hypothetical protein
MAEDKPTVRITSPTAMAGAVPSLVGYQPADSQVAVLGFKGTGYVGAVVVGWAAELGDRSGFAAEQASHIGGAFNGRADWFLAVGYRTEGPDRALLFTDAISQQLDLHAEAWTVHDGHAQQFSPDHGWVPAFELEDSAATEYTVASGTHPARSREDLAERHQPVPAHRQATPTDTASRTLAHSAPSRQLERAIEALDGGVASKTGLSDEQVAVRDNLLAEAAGSAIKADRLMAVFRRCTDENRPQVAHPATAAFTPAGDPPSPSAPWPPTPAAGTSPPWPPRPPSGAWTPSP